MKITRLETLLVKPRWLFLKLHTDEGLVGLGEPMVEGRARTVATAVAELEPCLADQDRTRVMHDWQAIYQDDALAGKLGHSWRNPETYHPDDGAAIDW